MKNKTKETLAGYLFVAPALLVFLAFIAFPFLFSLFLSLTEWNFISGWSGIKWVGLDNFIALFSSDKDFRQALVNTFLYAVTTVPVSIILGMVLAYLLNGAVKGKKILRFAFFIPYISSVVALSAVFRFMFRTDGIVNEVLVNVFGFSSGINWFSGGSALSRLPIILLLIWTGVGYCLIIYMAALQNVPKELYEASEMDGANGFKKFISITLPLISPTTFYLVVVRLIHAFQVFTSINIMTMGTPAQYTTSLVNEIYIKAFKEYKFGLASAEAVILFVIILAMTGINFWLQKKWVHY